MTTFRLPRYGGADLAALIPGLTFVGLLVVWAIHNGGYDADTWYWGALLALGLVVVVVAMRSPAAAPLDGLRRAALIAFAAYVAWSYLSIAWAGSPGDALAGSNKSLLYLLLFVLGLTIPWTPRSGLIVLVAFTLAIGGIAVVLLLRLASGTNVGHLVIGGRLAAPTGYFNSTAALFTFGAFTALALVPRRELPGPVRGALMATACASLQLALIVQSRGWLFTLPLITAAALFTVRDRLRTIGFAALPLLGAVIPITRLLDVYRTGPGLQAAAQHAGRAGLITSTAVLVVGALIAWADALRKSQPLAAKTRRSVGIVLACFTLLGVVVGGTVATHGHPYQFISRQWHGFSHVETSFSKGSHFGDVGSGRYDYWRVSLDAFLAHPIGGLGQDNFADYYITRRRTDAEPAWTHSLEMRLLASTGLVGLVLFATFLIAALVVAARAIRRGADELTAAIAAAALVPLLVWLIHGSVDWFWELPALSGPALGFLGMATGIGSSQTRVMWRRERPQRIPTVALRIAAGVALVAAATVLGLSYVSVREVSDASDIASANPAGALSDLSTAADLNPLSAVPGRLGGQIALNAGYYDIAWQRFQQAISREPGGWFSWFGAGLAASQLGDVADARHDFAVARRINGKQPIIARALALVDSQHPITPSAGLRGIVVEQ